MADTSVVVHVALWRELHELDHCIVDVLAIARRLRAGGIFDLESHLGKRLCNPLCLLHVELVGLDEWRNVVGIPLSLLEDPLDLRGLDHLLNDVHLLLSISLLDLAAKWNMVGMW